MAVPVDGVERLGDDVLVVAREILGQRLGIELAPGLVFPGGESIGRTKEVVSKRDGGFHTSSMTGVPGRVKRDTEHTVLGFEAQGGAWVSVTRQDRSSMPAGRRYSNQTASIRAALS